MEVTIDLDNPTRLELLKTYFTMKHLIGVDEMRKSSRGGFHIIKRGLSITGEESLDLRRFIGGDPNRIKFDSTDYHMPKQVLWNEKIALGKHYKSQSLTENNVLSQPLKLRTTRGVHQKNGR